MPALSPNAAVLYRSQSAGLHFCNAGYPKNGVFFSELKILRVENGWLEMRGKPSRDTRCFITNRATSLKAIHRVVFCASAAVCVFSCPITSE